jgi:hypothetical protein
VYERKDRADPKLENQIWKSKIEDELTAPRIAAISAGTACNGGGSLRS